MIEVSLNKLLRKIWNLPYNSHTGILHCVAHVSTISNIIYNSSLSMFSSAMTSSNLVKYIFIGSSKLVYSSTGYNFLYYGHEHLRFFSDNDHCTASIIRDFRHVYGLFSPCEEIIQSLSCI